MSAPRVLLLRHGETEWSRSGKHTSRTDVPLTDRGRLLAKATGDVGRHLLGGAPAVVWGSPRTRARDTAELAGLPVDRIDERLVEWDYGDYEGRTGDEIRAERPGWALWKDGVPNGETAAQVGARVDAVLAEARARRRRCARRPRALQPRAGQPLALPPARRGALRHDAAGWAVLGDERGVPRVTGSTTVRGVIRSATTDDVPEIVAMVHELADYEREPCPAS